jgi:catechol 2,3-dioxygenase-like lactoylglutathione lyase family enzyme
MKINQVKEICLYVSDLNISKKFYQDLFGFELINQVENRFVFLRVGKQVLLLFNPKESENQKNLPPHFAYGKQHIAFEAEVTDYSRWRDKVIKSGLEILQEQEWKNHFHSFYFQDPDGHVLEILPPGVWE